MAGMQIKEYVIKIRADVQDAQREIDKLGSSLGKVDSIKGIDNALQRQTESITKSIESITKEMAELRGAFKSSIDTKDLTQEFSRLTTGLDQSVKDMKTSIDGFVQSFEVLNNTSKKGGFNQIFKDLASNVKNMVDSYSQMSRALEGMMTGTIAVPRLDIGTQFEKSAGQIARETEAARKQAEQAQKEAEEAKRILDKTQETLTNAVNSFNEKYDKILTAGSEGLFAGTGKNRKLDLSALQEARADVEKFLAVIDKNKNIKGINLNDLVYSKVKGAGSRKSIENLAEQIDINIEEAREQARKASRQVTEAGTPATTVQIGVELAPDAVSEANIASIANQIKGQIIKGVQDKIKDSPIRIPVVLSSDAEAKAEDTAVQASDNAKKRVKEITKTLVLDVQANTEDLINNVNSAIADANEKITEQIKVKVVPTLMDEKEVQKYAIQTEEDIQDAFKRSGKGKGIPVDFSGIASNTFDQQSYGVLTDIKSGVYAILAKMGGGPPNPPGTGGNPPTLPSTGRTQQGKVQNVILQTPSVNIQKPVLTTVTGSLETTTETKTETAPTKPARSTFDFNKYADWQLAGRALRVVRGDQYQYNERSQIARAQKERSQEFAKALLTDIKSSKVTDVSGIANRNYYTRQSSSGYAWYGQPGQKLDDFQKAITKTFNDTRDTISATKQELTRIFEEDKKSTKLVPSGVNNKEVPPWLKRLIDYDIVEEGRDTKGARLKKLYGEQIKEDPTFIDRLKEQYLSEAQAVLDANETEYKEIRNQMALTDKKYQKAVAKLLGIEKIPDDKRVEDYKDKTENGKKKKGEITLALEKLPEEQRAEFEAFQNENRKLYHKLEENSEKAYSRIESGKGEVAKYKSMLGRDVYAEHLHRQHRIAQQDLANYTGEYDEKRFGKTYSALLSETEKKAINKCVTEAIQQAFGQDVFKGPKKYGISQIDVKNPNAQRRIRELEKRGLSVDETTGELISGRNADIFKNYGIDDIQQRLVPIADLATAQLKKQQALTDALAENEDIYNQYIEAWDNQKNKVGDTAHNQQVISSLKDQIAFQAAFFNHQDRVAKAEDELLALESTRNGKDSNLKPKQLSRYKELQAFVQSSPNDSWKDMSPIQVFTEAQNMLKRLQDSRQTERDIISEFSNSISEMIDADATRYMSKKTYGKLKAKLVDTGKAKIKLRNKAALTASGGIDFSSWTPTELAGWNKNDAAEKEIKKKLRAYEIGKGMRDVYGRPIGDTKEITIANPKMVQLGIPNNAAADYLSVPAPDKVSQRMIDAQGRSILDAQGKEMYQPIGVSIEEMEKYVSALTTAIGYMDKKAKQLPTTDEQIERQVAFKIAQDIKDIEAVLSSNKARLAMLDAQIKDKEAAGQATIRDEQKRAGIQRLVERDETSLRALQTDEIGNWRVERIKKDQAQLSELDLREQDVITSFEQLGVVSESSVKQIENLGIALREQKRVIDELRAVRALQDVNRRGDNIATRKTDEQILKEAEEEQRSLESRKQHLANLNETIEQLDNETKVRNALIRVLSKIPEKSGDVKTKITNLENVRDANRTELSGLRSYRDALVEWIQQAESPEKGAQKQPFNGRISIADEYGNVYHSLEAIADKQDDLISQAHMWSDAVEEGRKHVREMMKDMVPGGKTQLFLDSMLAAKTDDYGNRIPMFEQGRLLNELIDIRNQREELLGDIEKQQLRMQELGEVDQSLLTTRKQTYRTQIAMQTRDVTSARQSAIENRERYIQMIETAKEQEARKQDEKASREAEEARIKATQVQIEAMVKVPVEQRTAEIKQRMDAEVSKLSSALDETNQVMLDARRQAEEQYAEKIDILAEKATKLESLSGTVITGQEENAQNQKLFQQETVLASVAGYNELEQQIKEARTNKQIDVIPDLKKKQLELLRSSVIDLSGEIYDNLIAVQDAVEDGIKPSETKRLASVFLESLDQYEVMRGVAKNLATQIGANKKVLSQFGAIEFYNDEDLIQGQNPVEYAHNLINEEAIEKERVVALAREEVALAEQAVELAAQTHAYVTTPGGHIDTENNPIAQLFVEAEKRKQALIGAGFDAKEITDRQLAAAKRNSTQLKQLSEELEAAKDDSQYRMFLSQRANVPVERESRVDEAARKRIEERQRKKEEEKRLQQERDAERARSQLEIFMEDQQRGKAIEAKHLKAREDYNKDQKAKSIAYSRLGDDYYFANMTEEQGLVAKEIQQLNSRRLSSQRRKNKQWTDANQARLDELNVQAQKLNLDITDRGYVQPLITEKEYRENPDKYKAPLSVQNLRRGYRPLDAGADTYQSENLPASFIDVDEDTYNEQEDMLNRLNQEMSETVPAIQQFNNALKELAPDKTGKDLKEITAVYNKALRAVRNGKDPKETAQNLANWVNNLPTIEDKALHDEIQRGQYHATGTSNRQPVITEQHEQSAAEEQLANTTWVATTALDQFIAKLRELSPDKVGKDTAAITEKYNEYVEKVQQNKILPDYAASEYAKWVNKQPKLETKPIETTETKITEATTTTQTAIDGLHDSMIMLETDAVQGLSNVGSEIGQQVTTGVSTAETAIDGLHDSMITFETDAVQGLTNVVQDMEQKVASVKNQKLPATIQKMNEMLSSNLIIGQSEKAIEAMMINSSKMAMRSNTGNATAAGIAERNAMLQNRLDALMAFSQLPDVASIPLVSQVENTSSELNNASGAAEQLANSLEHAGQAATTTAQEVAHIAQESHAAQNTPLLTDGMAGATANAEGEANAFVGISDTVGQIEKAIISKNSALETETSLVSKETAMWNSLLTKVQAVADAAKAVKIEFSLKGMENLDENFLNRFGELIKAIENIKDPGNLQAIGDVLNGLKIGKDVGNNFKALGEGIAEFSQNISDGTFAGNNFNDLMDLIDRISNAGKHISDMATVLKNSGKAGKGLFGMKYSQDANVEEQMSEYLKLMDYLGNPSNIVKAQTLRRQAANDNISAKDQIWGQDYEQRLARAKELKATLEESNALEADAAKLLTKTSQDYTSKWITGYEGMQNEIDTMIANTNRRLQEVAGSDVASTYASGFQTLQNSIATANEEFRTGSSDAQTYKQAINDAFKEWGRFEKIDRAIFGKNKPVTVMETGDTYNGDNAKEDISNWIRDNYKKVTKDVTQQTQVIDGQQVEVFKAQVQDANGMVQNLTFSWSEVGQQIRMASSEVEKGKTGLDGMLSAITGKVKQLSTYWTAQLFNPYRLIGYVKQVMNVVKQYDTQMMEIRKVTQGTAEEFNKIKMSSFQVGDSVGATGKDVLSSIANWRRLGKTIEESQEAAKASNWLLNVSEFTNIDDATKSLVSMTQAFKDITYEDAIDKLNGVGDAFSSSTDQLAQGMQNVSSVLQVANNDVDQSIALLAAANDVTQDMSKASMGVRTVALRIAGTQDAKEQLEMIGEDTSDFIVQTSSKVDQKVRNYTKTAKTPNGISVLDDTGRLRDTYSILLDIAKVWDDIVAKDNAAGTNTSNALLELLAGKTRSNVLASILQAPDVLEEAYETSKSSKGVGQRELDIYLDSVQAKTTQLTNKLHELANITINTEGLKTLLDIINAILSGVNTLAKSFGSLNLAIGGIMGFAFQRHGLGRRTTVVVKMPCMDDVA